MSAQARSGRRAIGADVQALVRDVHAQALDCKKPDLAASLRATAARSETTPTVVVVGEQKRGKSSLVNALVGRPDVSPVAVEIATSCYLEFRHAEKPTTTVYLAGSDDPFEIDLAAVADWATVDGQPTGADGQPCDPERVARVEVGLDSPILEHLTLIDTPGVGGLVAGHAEMVLRALTRATALLFVIDANAPLCAPELAFLQRASEAVELVIFALTKKDLYPGTDRIAADNRALLAQHAPRYANCAIIPVSSRSALAAYATPDAERRARWLADSGLPELEADLVAKVADRAVALSLANALRHSLSVLANLEKGLAEQAGAAAADPELKAALEAEQARLADLNRDQQGYGPKISHRLNRSKIEMTAELNRRQSAIRKTYVERIQAAKDVKALRRTIEHELDADLLAMAAAMVDWLAERVLLAVREVFGEIVGESGLEDTISFLEADSAFDPDTALPDKRARAVAENVESAMMATGAVTTPSMVARMALGSAMSGWVMAPLGLVGITLGVVRARHRMRTADKNDLVTWARGCVDQATAAIREELDLRAVDVSYEVGEGIRAYVTQRAEEIKAALAAHQAALNQDSQTRAKAKAAADMRLAAVRQQAGRARTLMANVAEVRAPAPAAEPGPG